LTALLAPTNHQQGLVVLLGGAANAEALPGLGNIMKVNNELHV
jgi:hypothetical protein